MNPSVRPLKSLQLTVLLACVSSIAPLSIDTFLPAMPAIAEGLSVTQIQVQQVLSVYLFCYALMMLFHGSLSDSIGRRPVIIGGLTVFVLSSVGCALASDLSTLIFFRALQGLSGGAGFIVGRAIIRDKVDGTDAQKMMSHVTMLFSLAPAIAPIVGGFLYNAFDWRAIFWFMAIMGGLVLGFSYFYLAETHPKDHRQPFALRSLVFNYWSVMKIREFRLLALAVSFNSAGFFVYIASAPVFLMQHLGLNEQQFGYLFVPLVTGLMLGAFVSGKAAGYYDARQLVNFAYFMMFLGAVSNVLHSYFYPPSLIFSILPMAIYAFGMSIASPSITMTLLDQFPYLRGTCSSLQGFSQTLVISLVAGVVAPLVWVSPLHMALFSLSTLCLAFFFRSLYRYRINRLARLAHPKAS